ncbi:MAG TPA: acyltransferase, partial [Magnetospirillum sp.]|nr:acyltransferase [Magnetospirillum sp.]
MVVDPQPPRMPTAPKSRTPPQSGGHRFLELDGLRGWASLSVVCFHVFWEMFGRADPSFRTPVTAALFNGHMAVAIFFVLSGEALSLPYWQSRDRRLIARQALKRYPRLTIPIFCSCLLVFVLLSLGLTFPQQASALLNGQEWLGRFLPFQPSVTGLLEYATFGVYAHHSTEISYNPFLWTMETELMGSFIVFVLLWADKYIRRLDVVLVVVILACAGWYPFLCGFLVGFLLGKLHGRQVFARMQHTPRSRAVTGLGMAMALATGGYLLYFDIYAPPVYLMAASTFVVSMHGNDRATAFLRNRLSRQMGRLSFPLYLVHFPVLVSLGCGAVVVVAGNHMLSVAWMAAIGGLTVAVSLGV